ncbi:Dipeptide transport ATP-binding protein DppD [subsurface metagenome]
MDAIIEIQNAKVYYKIGVDFYIRAVDDVSLSIRRGQIMGIAGESGCGKSTLMKVCTCLIKYPLTVLQGRVIYSIEREEINALALKREELEALRWSFLTMVPQSAMNSLNPVSKIKQVFWETLKTHCARNDDEKKLKRVIYEVLESVGLSEEVLNMYPSQLSGGMKQRIVVALATITNPKVVFCDEPTSGLDLVTQKGILQFLQAKSKKENSALVLISHDMGIHAQIADILVVVYAGKIVEIAPTDDIFKEPFHPYTEALINSLPVMGDQKIKDGLSGAPPSLIRPPQGCRFHSRCPYADETICREQEPLLLEIQSGRYVACFKAESRGLRGGLP